MARLRLEYKSEPQSGSPFLKAEGAIEVLYPSELDEIKKYEDQLPAILQLVMKSDKAREMIQELEVKH